MTFEMANSVQKFRKALCHLVFELKLRLQLSDSRKTVHCTVTTFDQTRKLTAYPNSIWNNRFTFSLVGDYDLAVGHAVFFNAHIGIGLYVYYRQHMKKVSQRTRVMYSVYTSVLFNFGCTLFWSTTKIILPRNFWIRGLFGILTSVCLLAIGREYLLYVDTLSTEEVE